MPVNKLKEFLDTQGVKYITINHSPAYTAREIASSVFVPRREFAKTVIVRMDGKIAMTVLPASRHVDLEKLETASGANKVCLASEQEFETLFPGCETGAMPPFGNMYGMDTLVDVMLKEDDEITFNAGSHAQVIRLSFDDYENLVQPTVYNFSVKE